AVWEAPRAWARVLPRRRARARPAPRSASNRSLQHRHPSMLLVEFEQSRRLPLHHGDARRHIALAGRFRGETHDLAERRAVPLRPAPPLLVLGSLRGDIGGIPLGVLFEESRVGVAFAERHGRFGDDRAGLLFDLGEYLAGACHIVTPFVIRPPRRRRPPFAF